MKKPRTYQQTENDLKANPKSWIITGAAGFIGANICHQLLQWNQKVKAVDNFITGLRKNIDELKEYKNFEFVEADIRDKEFCQKFFRDADYVVHQAALGSVPRSLDRPMDSHDHNVNGFMNVLWECKNKNMPLVYASSSSVYGDAPELPKLEEKTGKVLSPYAATKAINELYAAIFAKSYGTHVTGLRYFNVFGPRQNPEGPYAAVIPKWVQALIKKEQVIINGDGETTRDFCYIANAVQANIQAAVNHDCNETGQVYNVAVEKQTSLNQLLSYIRNSLEEKLGKSDWPEAHYGDFRAGDIRHSLASTKKAKENLGYAPSHDVKTGLKECISWYIENP